MVGEDRLMKTHKLWALLGATALVAFGCDAGAVAPADGTTQDAVAAVQDGHARGAWRGPARLHDAIVANGDAESQALLTQAQEHRDAARQAMTDGDRDLARSEMEASRAAFHEAVARTFPDLAERMATRSGPDSGGPWRGMRDGRPFGRLADSILATGNQEAMSLLARADSARRSAREAFAAGHRDAAQRAMTEARDAMRSAVQAAFPDRQPFEGRQGRWGAGGRGVERMLAAAERVGNDRVNSLVANARTEIEAASTAREAGDEESVRTHHENLRGILSQIRSEIGNQMGGPHPGPRRGLRSMRAR
jgi:hypothetical protein